MADTMAPSILPTIKCSNCARDIEISQMGEHVCSVSEQPTLPPEPYNNLDRTSPYKISPSNGPSYLKPGRSVPPRVDTNVANRVFFPQEQLTPISDSPSPISSGWPQITKSMRSATMPMPRAPPSPEPLSSNLDCAFPPFPTTKPTQNKPSLHHTEPNLMYAPMSPRTFDHGGILQKMNNIVPGPFDINVRRESPEVRRRHQRNGTAESLKELMLLTDAGHTTQRPSTAGGAGHSRTISNSSTGSMKSVMPPTVLRKNGYGGFGPPRKESLPEPLSASSRSRTFPQEYGQQSISRPSEPTTPNDISLRMMLASQDSFNTESPLWKQNSTEKADPSLLRPPRASSLKRRSVHAEISKDVPSVPSTLSLAEEFGIGNPYHTPSESQSSDRSGTSEASNASSRSSASRLSQKLRAHHRQASDTTQLSKLMADLESSFNDLQPNELPSSLPTKPKELFIRAPLLRQKTAPALLPPESPGLPVNHDIQGRLPMRELVSPQSKTRARSFSRSTTRAPRTSKGKCKGCNEDIYGKSVSSADGRLTGRYHKDCFVCNTCLEPFKTATFYVINDKPYCGRHYHKLNGSVCTACDKGIEGQYLETEYQQKFHPTCLTCADCTRSLRHDYFEMNGRVYCKRDAFRRAQQGRSLAPGLNGENRMERRTTRLMMM